MHNTHILTLVSCWCSTNSSGTTFLEVFLTPHSACCAGNHVQSSYICFNMLERLSDNPKQINAVFVHKHDDYIWRKKMVGPSVGDFLCAKSSIIPDYQFMF